jgi:glutamate formiminotransferase / formiminotetrahydrofolate cyclodeaminase
MNQIIECVPNFSEGRDLNIINQITAAIESVEGVKLLNVDPGAATNRTVVTFVGSPQDVVEGAFAGIKKAAELIDMSKHKGEHPRMGATDVCPFIPIANISMEETVAYANQLADRVGSELQIPVYLYESAATSPDRKNLATIRSGEYEGFAQKILLQEWKPDYGPSTFNLKSGATVIGARDFLVAYNVNLNTKSERKANSIAFDIREAGRVKKKGDAVVKDNNGEAVRIPGMLKSVKGIGWYIDEYGIAQVSMNLTNINDTALHEAFEACCKSAEARGVRVTGSELVGLVPKKVMIDAGRYFLNKQGRSAGVSEDELIFIAIKTMGLEELGKFDPQKRIIEYMLEDKKNRPLINLNLVDFANMTASDSPAPGGGSIAAYLGVLGASLGTMVANLSAVKKGWEKQVPYFSEWSQKGQHLKDQLLNLVDDDTQAFNAIITAIRLPKSSEKDIELRAQAITAATKGAIEVPLRVMKVAYECYDILEEMAKKGNQNSISDAGVGALSIRSAIYGAYLNVKINCKGFEDTNYVETTISEAKEIFDKSNQREATILTIVDAAT